MILLFLECYGVLFALCQAEEDMVYIGTGVNGSYDGKEILSVNNTILLGGLFAIHESQNGVCARSGIQSMILQDVEAMVLSIDRINKDKKLLPGITVAYEIRDTCLLPNHALEQSLSFLRDRNDLKDGKQLGVSGVVGTSFSSVSVAVATMLRLFKVPQISYSATADVLSGFDYFFRIVPPDSLQAMAIADIIVQFNWTYIIVIYSDDAYGRGLVNTLWNQLQLAVNSSSTLRQLCVPYFLAITDSATSKQYDEIVKTINKEWVANASVVVLFGHLRNAEGLFEAVSRRQAIDIEFANRNITWIGSDSWGGAVPRRYRKIAHGSLSTIPRKRLSKEFDKHFLSLHPRNNSANPWFNKYWEEVFNCSLGNRADVSQCDLNNQRLSTEDSFQQNTFLPFVNDAVYAFAEAIHNMQQDYCPEREGLCPPMFETQSKVMAIDGELLLRYLYNVSFNGTAVDRIKFDKNRSLVNGYDIVNLQMDSSGQFTYKKVGKWDVSTTDEHKMSLLFYDNIQWKHSVNGSDVPESICSRSCGKGQQRELLPGQVSCCWTCRQCTGNNQVGDGVVCRECQRGYKPNEDKSRCVFVEPTFLTWSDPLAIIVVILAIFGIAATTFVSTIFILYRNDRIIKASSRELTAVLLCGIMLCYLMPFFYLAKPIPALCGIRRFGVGFCFSLCFSALLVKTNRIHRIFNRESLSVRAPPLISPTSQLFFTAMLVSVQVVIAAVWLAAEQPSVKFTYHENFTTLLSCGENPYIGLSVTLAYNLLLLLVTLYFAFQTRKVPVNFNEARFINLNMYTLCVLWLAFVPTYFITTALGTSFHTGTIIIGIILSGTAILCCLLVPKVYFLFSSKRKGSNHPTSSRSNSEKFCQNKVCIESGSGSVTPGIHKPFNIGDRIDVSIQTEDVHYEQETPGKINLDDVFVHIDTCLENPSNLSVGVDASVQTDSTFAQADASIQTDALE